VEGWGLRIRVSGVRAFCSPVWCHRSLDGGALERPGRYNAALWKHLAQTLLLLARSGTGDGLSRRAPRDDQLPAGGPTFNRAEVAVGWISEFCDEEVQLLFRQAPQITSRHVGSAALKLGVFD
jgi:hypothetical protein